MSCTRAPDCPYSASRTLRSGSIPRCGRRRGAPANASVGDRGAHELFVPFAGFPQNVHRSIAATWRPRSSPTRAVLRGVAVRVGPSPSARTVPMARHAICTQSRTAQRLSAPLGNATCLIVALLLVVVSALAVVRRVALKSPGTRRGRIDTLIPWTRGSVTEGRIPAR
jgi:hypothetical protein